MEPSEEFRATSQNPEAQYEELYLCGMRCNDYNFTLCDFSFFQFGISKENHVRFAYYPNPFFGSTENSIREIGELGEYLKEGAISVEEYLHRISEVRRSQHPPLIRYENAPDQYVEFEHPTSHLHIGYHLKNRWPSKRLLAPSAFTAFVVKQYYSDFWYKFPEVSVLGRTVSPNILMVEETQSCRILSQELFSAVEGQSFHFT